MNTGAFVQAAGDSAEQQEAEKLLISLLAERLDVTLKKRKIRLPEGEWLELDGACEEPLILVEAWAHQGQPKAAQKNKVMTDAFKLLFAQKLLRRSARMILAFGDSAAASHFKGKSWMARALRDHHIEVYTVGLPRDVKERIRKAQERQYR